MNAGNTCMLLLAVARHQELRILRVFQLKVVRMSLTLAATYPAHPILIICVYITHPVELFYT
jgi:hypothetical protein